MKLLRMWERVCISENSGFGYWSVYVKWNKRKA